LLRLTPRADARARNGALDTTFKFAEIRQRGFIVDRAAQRGRSEQSSLRTSEDRDIIDVEGIDVRNGHGEVRVGQRYIVDEVARRALTLIERGGGRDTANRTRRTPGDSGFKH